ncbi:MAG: WD40 repeat domain-containing serine/threonine protein kinase, partial [Planctomycetota bacterium]
MGVVYRAVQESPRRTVAIKVLREGHASPERLRRFRQEAELLGRLQHPGIAQIFEAGTEDLGSGEQPYFAMELVDGESLTAYARASDLTVVQRLELLAQVCDAVHHAHEEGVIHRDLKPENVLVGRDGRVKVLDFGIARAVEDTDGIATQLTADGDLLGTLAYMAPEQLEGTSDGVTGAVDVYALGAIAFELMAGRLPFDLSGLPLASAIQLRREQDPPVLGRLRPELRGDIETIVGKALEGDPSRRYASPAALGDDLRAHLEDRPIAARPPSRIYQVVKFSRRHRALVLGTTATLAASLVGVAVSLNFAVRAVRNEARAAENALAARAVVAQATQELLEQGDVRRALETWSRVETFSGRERDVFEDALVRALLPITLPSEFGRGRCRWIDSERILCAVGEEFVVLRRGTSEVVERISTGERTVVVDGDVFPLSEAPREYFDLDVDAGRIVARLGGGPSPRNAVAAAPSPQGGYQMVTREGRDGVVHLHQSDDSIIVLEPQPWESSVFRFSPDGRRLVVASHGGQFAVHDTANGERIAERKGMRSTSCITYQITPDSSTLAAYDAESWLHLLDLNTLETRTRHRVHATGNCFRGNLSPDGTHFAVESNGRIAVTCLPTGETRWIDHAHGNLGIRVEWSPDGRTLMVRSLDTLT